MRKSKRPEPIVAFTIPLKFLTSGMKKLGVLKPGKESPRLYEKARELLIAWCDEPTKESSR